ncbi:MAG: hypothetical protein QGI86_27420 [Candidatus Poribacteria bacterium]|jgi:hypothetical protein|nr:hypothetical protein [Candidatus Poribacteria bacterium]MDP6751900.1 hypothetical protein [Candidatus Poribacteria bacterium]MDP6999963.1 hypothetical protein [Candidatus Poribacteria bacterium]
MASSNQRGKEDKNTVIQENEFRTGRKVRGFNSDYYSTRWGDFLKKEQTNFQNIRTLRN